MRKIFLSAVMAITLSGCATLGNVQLRADQAIVTTQVSFKALQQIAITGIQSGRFTGATKAKIIDLNDKGQALEDKIVATRDSSAITGLAGVVQHLTALGVK
jgi:uncharacterized protein YceK